MESLEQQIELLHKSLIEKFKELKEENQHIEIRLKNIESTLDNENKTLNEETNTKVFEDSVRRQSNVINDSAKKPSSKIQAKPSKMKEKKDKPIIKSKPKNNQKKIEKHESTDEEQNEDFDQDDSYQNMCNLDNLKLVADEEASADELVDDGFRHDVETKPLPNRSFEAHSFRPVTGWRNKMGNFEISKEVIEFSESKVKQNHSFFFK